MNDAPRDCFHCGEPLAGRSTLWMRVGDADVAVCCPGCRAAAELIASLGLEDFYRLRSSPSTRPPAQLAVWSAYDEPALLEALTRREGGGRSVVLIVDGLTCAACSWLITHALLKLDGVNRASVNLATARAHVVWDDAKLPFSSLLAAIAELGYRPQPVTVEAAAARAREERNAILKRLAVAGLGMMQVMMFAVAMYSGEWHGMDASIRTYLRIVSLIVATPVMLYGGWPFFVGAVRALASRKITMDVPVALGLMLAYFASVLDTWRQSGEVYFDSITMFIFFLTIARFVEMVARHRCTSVSDALCRVLPATAHRFADAAPMTGDDQLLEVAVAQLRVGDRLLVRAGEIVPADGIIVTGDTRIDESLVSGEPLPLIRAPGSAVIAGSLNVQAPIQMRVTAIGAATVLSSIVALLNRALAERPRVTQAADLIASRFLTRVLLGAALVFAVWSWIDPSRAFAATLSVLVVACPCALSLATLVAVASANAALARRGVLVTHADAIEGLAKATRMVFDKTGTLTAGVISVTGVSALGDRNAEECLKIAAALEAASEHPIARAFATTAPAAKVVAGDVHIAPGQGLEGTIGGERFRIGTRAFAGVGHGGRFLADPAAPSFAASDDDVIVLGDVHGPLAQFTLGDRPRADSASAVAALRALGLKLEILSGDAAAPVAAVAAQCGFDAFAARQSPLQKLQRVRDLTAGGDFVAVVGDGINDAPVLGGAGVSIAMGRGSALAHAGADLILVGDSLQALPEAFVLARRARTIIRQNLAWAAGYNLTAMPLAAMGWVPPWLAAIGMSASSIFVVLNSLRLLRSQRPRRDREDLPSDSTALARHTPSTVVTPLIRSS